MRFIIIIFIISIFKFSCKVNNNINFYKKTIEFGDSIKVYLFKEPMYLIDSIIFLNTQAYEESINISINRNEKGWSCIFDSICLNNIASETMENKHIKVEEKLMNIIKTNLDIKYYNRFDLLNYWKQLNPNIYITSNDKSWNTEIANFYNIFVLNKLKVISNQYYIDTCEKSQFDQIRENMLKDTINTFYMTIKTHVPSDSVINTNAYLFKPFKKMSFVCLNASEDYIIRIENMAHKNYR